MKIPSEVLAELDRATITGREVRLPAAINRPLYVKVDKVLKAAGGKWNRKIGAHVFEDDPADVLEQAMLTGQIRDTKAELGQFHSPESVAMRAAAALHIKPGMKVLEPQAGGGALARVARAQGAEVTCVEIYEPSFQKLGRDGFYAILGDFLTIEPDPVFDGVLMNPPFARQADARHVLQAMEWLKPGGRLVAIMSAAVTFRHTELYERVRTAVFGSGGTLLALPAGSFKAAGTAVNAVIVTYNRPM